MITSPSQIFLNPSAQDATCFGNPDGWATAPATGGAGIYYYNWQPIGQNSDTAKNLAAGIYTVTATDVNGCFADTSVTIGSPPQIIVTPAITNASCFGINDGAISTVTTQGVSPYEYFWIGSGNVNPYSSSLLSGTYPLLVTDANGCEELDTFYVLQPDSLMGFFFFISPGCPSATDGYVEMDVAGGTVPYYYMWNGDVSLTGSSLSHISAGTIEVSVTDAHGCSFTMIKIVESYPDLVIDAGPDVSIELGQKTLLTATADRSGDYFYQWLPPYNLTDEGAVATYAYPYVTITYLVKVTDVFSGCAGEDSVTVIILPASYVLVPNAFTPNGDGLNDLLFPVMGDLAELEEFKIFNRWGQAVFSDKMHGWDGKYQGTPEEVGTYIYELRYKIDGHATEVYSKSGSIVLIR
jgi:gliding motility-associated-like protein